MTEPDLTFIARQLDRVLSELQVLRDDNGRFRDDLGVLTAMVVRVEHTQGRTLDQIARMNDRIRKLEEAHDPH